MKPLFAAVGLVVLVVVLVLASGAGRSHDGGVASAPASGSDPLSAPGSIAKSDRFAVRGRKVPTLDDELRQIRADIVGLKRPGQRSLFAPEQPHHLAAAAAEDRPLGGAAALLPAAKLQAGLFRGVNEASPGTVRLHSTMLERAARRIFVAVKAGDHAARVIQKLHITASHPAEVFYGLVSGKALAVFDELSEACTMAKAPVCAIDQLRFRTAAGGGDASSATEGAFSMYQGEPFAMILEAEAVDTPHAWDEVLRDALVVASRDVTNPVLSDFSTKRGVAGVEEAGDKAAPCTVDVSNARVATKDAPGVRPTLRMTRVASAVRRVRSPFASPDFVFGVGRTIQRLQTLPTDAAPADRVWDLATRLQRFQANVVVSTVPLLPRTPLSVVGDKPHDVLFPPEFQQAIAIDIDAKKDLAADPLRNRCRALR